MRVLRWLIWAGLLVRGTVLAGTVEKVEEHTYKLRSASEVRLFADEGDVRVRGWDREEAYLKITKRVRHPDRTRAEELAEELVVIVRHRKDRLEVREPHHQHGSGWGWLDHDRAYDYRIDYELSLPRSIRLKLTADEGDLDVADLTGLLLLEVDEGKVRLRNLRDCEIEIQVDEGRVEGEDIRGEAKLRARLDEGRIWLARSEFTRLDVETDEGGFVLDDLHVGKLTLRTDEGDVEANLTFSDKPDVRIYADEGDLRLTVPGDLDARLRLATSEGRIRSDFPLSIRERDDDGQSAEGTLGTGKGRLLLVTEEGSINLRKRQALPRTSPSSHGYKN